MGWASVEPFVPADGNTVAELDRSPGQGKAYSSVSISNPVDVDPSSNPGSVARRVRENGSPTTQEHPIGMKRTDLHKQRSKKIDEKMKSGIAPPRFGAGSKPASPAVSQPRVAPPRLVPIACKLPSELVGRLRERTVKLDGGMNAAMAQAVELWLDSNPADNVAGAA